MASSELTREQIKTWYESNLQGLLEEQKEVADQLKQLGINVTKLSQGDPAEYAKFQQVHQQMQRPQQAVPSGSGGSGDDQRPCDPPLTNLGKGFSDIAGARQAIDELVVGFVYPQQYSGLFQTASSGLLLFGPPGTGKTLLAKAAVASLPGVVMFAPSPASLKGRYVGETEKNIQRVFECAISERAAHDPNATKSVLFFDEFENIARKRDPSDPGLSASVTTLLQQMDGIGSSPDVAVMAATNYPQDLDDAILRRFDVRVLVDLPSYEARLLLILRAIAKRYQPEVLDNLRIIQKTEDEVKDPYDRFTWLPNVLGNIYMYGRSENRLEPFEQEIDGDEELRLASGQNGQRRLVLCRRACDFNRVINDNDIRDIAKMTGPFESPEVRAVVGRTQRTEKYEYSEYARSKYGYSGSDIDKLMNAMMNVAARRALPTPPEMDNSPAASRAIVQRDNEGNVVKYVHCPPDVCRLFDTIIATRDIPPQDQHLLVTYDFTLCDVCQGFAKYPSTVNQQVYEQLIDYHVPVPKHPILFMSETPQLMVNVRPESDEDIVCLQLIQEPDFDSKKDDPLQIMPIVERWRETHPTCYAAFYRALGKSLGCKQ